MKRMRKATAVVVSLMMLFTMLLMSGCSTPEVAVTAGGYEFKTGEYLANLWSNFVNVYYGQQLYYYDQPESGMDVWAEMIPYGEGDDARELSLVDYLKESTMDGIKRQAAVKQLMQQYNIVVPEEEREKANDGIKEMLAYYGLVSEKGTIQESKMIEMGFNLQSFTNMYMAVNVDEPELFYQLYGKGGQREVPEEEVKAYYENGYVAYKEISLSQMDEDGNVLSDADIAANREMLQTYLDMYNSGSDMDTVISKYNEDTNPTTTTAATTTTTAAETTTTVGAETETTTTTVATTTTTTTTSSTETTTTTTTTNPNVKVLTTVSHDEKAVEAVKMVPVGEAMIVQYTDSNEDTYLALIYRLDMAEAGENYNFENQREACLYGMKFEEYDAELMELIKTLEINIDQKAIDMCDPKAFATKMNEFLGIA